MGWLSMKKAILSMVAMVGLVIGLADCGVSKAPNLLGIKSKLSTSEMVNQIGSSTVALVFYNEEAESSKRSGVSPFCTGVWVGRDLILTADHCAKAMVEFKQDTQDEKEAKREEASKEEPKTLEDVLRKLFGDATPPEPPVVEDGLSIHYIQENEVAGIGKEPTAWHLSNVIAYDEQHDLALLRAAGSAIPPHRIASLAKVTPSLGERIHVVGHVTGLYWTYTEGNVAAYREDMPDTSDVKMLGPWLQVSAPIFFGNSGGGIFNEYGELVGIADWIKKAPLVGFCVHLETIRSFLELNAASR